MFIYYIYSINMYIDIVRVFRHFYYRDDCHPKEPYRTASVLIAGDNFGADAQPVQPDMPLDAHRHEDVDHRGNMRRHLSAQNPGQ